MYTCHLPPQEKSWSRQPSTLRVSVFESQAQTARPVAFTKTAPRHSRITSRCCSVPRSSQSGDRCLQQRITCGAMVHGTCGTPEAGTCTPYVQCVAPRGKLPCASGTQEAGTRSPYVLYGVSGAAYLSA